MIHILKLFSITELKRVNSLVNERMHMFRKVHFSRNRAINHTVHSEILMSFFFVSDDNTFFREKKTPGSANVILRAKDNIYISTFLHFFSLICTLMT